MNKNRRYDRGPRKVFIKPHFRMINGERRRIRGYFRKKAIPICLFVLFLLAIPFTSPNVSADENLVLFTNYYQYDNNESLDYHIIGTNNTTYTLMIVHRDSDAPLVIAHARTPSNRTMTNGTIGLYEFTSFGMMELRAFNRSNNQSAKTEFKLVPSPDWWTREVDRLIADADARYGLSLYIIFAVSMTLVGFLAVGYLKNREKMKAASGELTFAEKMMADGVLWYKTYANDIATDNPHVQAEVAQSKLKMMYWRLMDLLKLKMDKMGGFQAIQKEIDELIEKIPFAATDTLDEKVASNAITQEEVDDIMEKEDWERLWPILFPGEKRISLTD